jgi:hypothetical protein
MITLSVIIDTHYFDATFILELLFYDRLTRYAVHANYSEIGFFYFIKKKSSLKTVDDFCLYLLHKQVPCLRMDEHLYYIFFTDSVTFFDKRNWRKCTKSIHLR